MHNCVYFQLATKILSHFLSLAFVQETTTMKKPNKASFFVTNTERQWQ